jgi:N-acyl-D-amino-acid deacylase
MPMKRVSGRRPGRRDRLALTRWYIRWGWISLVLLPVVLGLLALSIWRWRHPRYDLLVLNGRVFDGEKMLPMGYGLAIRNGRIEKIGFVHGLRTRAKINAWNRVVSPGFIEAHAHVESSLAPGRPFHAPNFVRMGVTTVITGNCGDSVKDVGKTLASLDQAGGHVNLATLIGHRAIREAVMGQSRGQPNAEQLDEMRRLVHRAMFEGAIGISTGLEYSPGAFATQDEIVSLLEVVAPWHGIYATHIRNEGLEYAQALAEAVQTAQKANVPLHVSHLKIAAPSKWAEMREALSRLASVQPAGRPVTQDVYVYTASSSSLDLLFPAEFRGLTNRAKQLLQDPEQRKRLIVGMLSKLRKEGFSDYSYAKIASFRDSSLKGKSLEEVALILPGIFNNGALGMGWLPPLVSDPRLRGQVEAVLYLFSRGGAQMVYQVIDEQNVSLVLQNPRTVIGSDSAVRNNDNTASHPRGYGNFPRVLAEYVRRQKALTLEQALRKMTSQPADIFGITRHGRIAQGFAADIVIFDPENIQDHATYVSPLAHPTGVDYVIVNGQVVCERDSLKGVYPGRGVRLSKPSPVPPPPPKNLLITQVADAVVAKAVPVKPTQSATKARKAFSQPSAKTTKRRNR